MAAENALWNQGSDSATKEKWFWDNSTCDRDTLHRSKHTQVSDGSRSGGPYRNPDAAVLFICCAASGLGSRQAVLRIQRFKAMT